MENMNGAVITLIIVAVVALFNLIYAGLTRPFIRSLYSRVRLNIVAHKKDHKLVFTDQKNVLDELTEAYRKPEMLHVGLVNFEYLLVAGFTYLAFLDKKEYVFSLFAEIASVMLVWLALKLFGTRAQTNIPVIGGSLFTIILTETVLNMVLGLLSGLLIAAIV